MYRVIFSFWKCPWKMCSAFRCTKMFHFSVGTAGSTSTTRGRGEEETAAHSRAQPKSCRGCRLPAAMVSTGCRKLNCVLVAKCTATVLHTVSSDRILRLKMHCKGRVWRLCGFVMWPFLEDLMVSGGQHLSQTPELPAKLNVPIFHHDAVLQLLRCTWP